MLILGVLSISTGTCLSGLMLVVQSAFGGETSPKGPYGLAAMSAANWLLVTGVFLVPTMIGAIDIVCALKVQKGSTVAAVFATVLVCMQIIAATIIGSIYYSDAPTLFQPGLISISTFVGAMAVAFWSLFLLARVLRIGKT